MNRKVAVATLALCLLVLPQLTWAKRARTVEKSYEVVTQGPGGIRSTNGVVFDSKRGERLVSIAITDDVATNVPARVGQDFNGDGKDDRSDEICTSTDKPIKLRGGATVTVWMGHGSCGALEGGRYGGWFQGSVTAIFTR